MNIYLFIHICIYVYVIYIYIYIYIYIFMYTYIDVNILPKNGEIARLLPTNSLMCGKMCFTKTEWVQWWELICTMFYLILHFNSRAVYTRLKYIYSVISVMLYLLPAHTKKWQSTSLWAPTVRFLYSWGAYTYNINI